MGISTPGIGSGLDVNGIVSKLMSVEAQPLTTFDKKSATFQAKLSALGSVSGAISSFQSALSGLTSATSFQSISANSGDTSVMVGSATNKAVPGIYNVNVTQLAQAQSLTSGGVVSNTAAIGLGGSTTLSFQLGTISGGRFGLTGTALGAGVLTSGVSNGSLSINGTVIATDASTRSAKALADAINAKIGNTGVSASTATTTTSATLFGAAGASTFGDVATTGAGSYALSVAGIQIASQGAGVAAGAGVSAANIDLVLAGSNGVTDALSLAGIGHTGTAAAGTLQFTAADGSNIAVSELAGAGVSGGIGKTSADANTGSSVTSTSSIILTSASASPITVAGTAPALLGLTAGTGGSYTGAAFAQDATQVSGNIVIDSTNNTLTGIRDAINKAAIGITATIVSDGSATPNHLVLSSTKTGVSSSFKIGVTGSPAETALQNLFSYDPTDSANQKLSQNAAAQSTTLNVNGIAVTSTNNTISGAIQGVTLTVGKVGSANLSVAQDTSAVSTGVNAFVKAYNDLNTAIKNVSGYDPTTKTGGPLLGDVTVQTLQSQVRKQLSTTITGLDGSLTTLSQVGISFQKDGSLALDSTKLQKAITNNFADIAGLFAAVGKASDPLVSFTTSTSATQPGDYALNITTLASQGSLTSDAAYAPTDSITIDANTKWNVTINGTTPTTASHSASVSLTAGSYTPAQLATLIQSAVNATGSFSSNALAVNVSIDDAGKLKVVSAQYGSISNLSINSGTGTTVASLFGAAIPVAGVDIAGTLGGQAAGGSGQVLTGSAGSAVAGLKVTVTGGIVGDRGTVGFSQGYAYQLTNLAANFLGSKGFIAGRTDGLNTSIKDVATQRDAFSAKLVDIEARYRAQYSALDTAISSMNATSSFLTQQFAALAKQTN